MSDIPTTVCTTCGLELEITGSFGDHQFGLCERCGKQRDSRTVDRVSDAGADRETRAAKPCCKRIIGRESMLHEIRQRVLAVEGSTDEWPVPDSWCGLPEGHQGACATVTAATSSAVELVDCEQCKAQKIAPKGNHLTLHFVPGTVTPCRRSWPPPPVAATTKN